MLLILVLLPLNSYALHAGPVGGVQRPHSLTIPVNMGYLIFDRDSMRDIGEVFGGATLTVEKTENGWLYFHVDVRLRSYEGQRGDIIPRNTCFYGDEKLNNKIGKIFEETGITFLDFGRNMNNILVRLKGKIFLGTGEKPVRAKKFSIGNGDISNP